MRASTSTHRQAKPRRSHTWRNARPSGSPATTRQTGKMSKRSRAREEGPGPGGGGQELVHKWTWMLVLVCKMDSYGEVTYVMN